MLNVRIVKGGCRGREAVRFGVVSLNFFSHPKKPVGSINSFMVKKLPFEVKLHAKTVVSGGKTPSKPIPATSVAVSLFSCLHSERRRLISGNYFQS